MLYTFYGDDFTGSTDALEQLAANGVRSALFLAPPSEEQLAMFPGIQAFGIAGDSRSRSPQWMSENLNTMFHALQQYGAPLNQYKVCSTFDSSPDVGNIGRAIEIGMATFRPEFVPIVVGAPHLQRFVRQGELFALAPDGAIHRIDGHPMSRHPVTPMREADLRRHLAAQTRTPVGLVTEEHLASCASAGAALQHEIAVGHRAILFDTANTASLRTIGELLWQKAASAPLFAIGSSGLTASMIGAWRTAGLLETVQPPPAVAKVSPLLVISGSCSVVTGRQIEWALANGFHGIALEPERLMQASSRAYLKQIAQSAIAALSAGLDTVLYTAVGMPTQNVGGEALSRSLGELLRGILAATPVQRVVICGGDTSSHAVQQLEVFAMTWRGSIQPGAPVCLTHALFPDALQFELILKGGQVGSDDFFARARG